MNKSTFIPTTRKALLAGSLVCCSLLANDVFAALTITDASWSNRRDRVTVRGDGDRRDEVTVVNAYDISQRLGRDEVGRRGDWRVRDENPDPVPCAVSAFSDNDPMTAPVPVRNAPDNCAPKAPAPLALCADGIDNDGDGLIDFPADPGCVNADDNDEFNAPPPAAQCSDGIDNDADGLVDFPADPGCVDPADNNEFNAPPPAPAQCADGLDNDGDGLIDFPADTGCTDATDNDETNAPQPPIPNVSVNSTSQNGIPVLPVIEQPFSTDNAFNILASNDLGMHCGDLDTRISSILPPFNAVHSQVIQRGAEPRILTPADGIEVVYTAASNPNDPILTGINSAGSGPVASSMLPNGSVYKTNFWDIAFQAYDAFYPSGILDLFYSPTNPAANLDLGLPMPNVEVFYLGSGRLGAEQQAMNGRLGAYELNTPLAFNLFTLDQPFFINFPFGYTNEGVDWFEAAGIPMTAFDDFGRENPWPLMRVQARAGGQVIASIDTVLPISGEANCGECHNAPGEMVYQDGTVNGGVATANLSTVASVIEDDANVPFNVSLEWAADINILRLHDQKHGTNMLIGTTMDVNADTATAAPFKSVVCQSCHYTPALDLAQLGPLGPENDATINVVLDDGSANGVPFTIDSLANGRDQIKHKSMSNVMHSHHGQVTDTAGNRLFPEMPPAVNPDGSLRDPVAAREILNETCYQCHPGRRTDCLRGAMANGGMLCQDCHGNMEQVGNDFTRNVSLSNIGAFELGDDFYTNPNTPRVPWANEPGCGSCHTGDANDNMHGDADTLGDPEDGIRLMQAFRIGDPKATPIVPSNTRFAENMVTADPNPNDAFDPTGNPMLYRVSTGHGGVFCEGCHGATHGIWPNKNPDANDNVAAMQLQGHAGTIIECSVCHGNANLGNTLDGPHGMHAVGRTDFADGGHENLAERNPNACRACHGQNGEGTVLSRTAADRDFRGMEDGGLVAKGTPVTCTMCHGNEL
jgi:hypothetical protein